MLDDKEETGGVKEERGELDGGTAAETQGDPGALGQWEGSPITQEQPALQSSSSLVP